MNDFMQFCASHGLIVNSVEIGKITRCGTTDKPRSDNGAFLFDGIGGWVQNWAIHSSPILFRSDKKPDFIDYARLKKRRDENIKASIAEKAQNQAKAASKAKELISQAELNLSVYLASKGFPDMSTLVINSDDGTQRMIVPMYYQGKICGAQVIHSDSTKRFIYGARTKGATFDIGNGKDVYLAEGYATCLSIQSVVSKISSNYKIRCCFSAGNMKEVAKLHDKAILICDFDASGVGQKVGEDSGLKYWLSDTEGEDFNDFINRAGMFRAMTELRKLFTQNEKACNIGSSRYSGVSRCCNTGIRCLM